MQPARVLIPALTAVAAAGLVFWAGSPASAAPTPAAKASPLARTHVAVPSTQMVMTFRSAMGELWEDHITWTRMFIISELAGAPDLQMTTERLLQNQVDIGNAIKPYYGDAAGDHLSDLLRDPTLIATDVVAAARAGDTVKLNGQVTPWRTNADDIGDYLNPDNWPAASMKAMMRHHLDLTTAEVAARLNQDRAGDIAAYDQVHLHILTLADALTDGIVAQFPDAFADSAQSTSQAGG
jgi:hypothetical protein